MPSWEEYRDESDRLAREAENLRETDPKGGQTLFRQSGEAAKKSVEKMEQQLGGDAEERNRLILAVVERKIEGHRYAEAKRFAQQWIDRNSIPGETESRLRSCIVVASAKMTTNSVKRRRRNTQAMPITSMDESNPELPHSTTNPLDDVASAIHEIPNADLRQRCIRALEMSIALDIDRDPPEPASPEIVAQETGVNIKVQKQYRIALTKEMAFDFLQDLGVAVKKGGFLRRLSAKKFEAKFGRSPSSMNNKPMLFSYSEILHFEDLEIALALPQVLASALDNAVNAPSQDNGD